MDCDTKNCISFLFHKGELPVQLPSYDGSFIFAVREQPCGFEGEGAESSRKQQVSEQIDCSTNRRQLLLLKRNLNKKKSNQQQDDR